MNKWWKTLGIIIGTAVLTELIPFSSFFRNVETLIHEFGHALLTLVLSGKVHFIYLFSNHSGVTYSYVNERWQFIPIALAGYILSAILTIVLFWLYNRNQHRKGLIGLTILTLICVLFFVRNAFGVFWCIGFIALNIGAYLLPWKWVRDFYYLLISFICLVESVIGPMYLAFLSITSPASAGDAANLSRITFIPAIIWSLLFTVIAIWCAGKSIALFLNPKREA
ncbi:M50 family peptidase [Paenibacillus albiflavus]|uniref:M50 family peptidase n=1 Tax=Paenibacillus albiflavus TaxID=2545760 RepID=A0A4R4EE79_9BACL|nr:M50 family metallopeptidase [Paenibacillus albiflavus]TCZ76325.1 M50 family peptidase [Paenibacillus albiflavus]